MQPFVKTLTIITPLDKSNVDTDQIIPKQFLKLIKKTGFGEFLFYNWRYDAEKNPNPDFVLNDPRYKESKILVTGDNFGCGSSREHAVWALHDYGFSVIIAPSFADIFYENCFKNGILAIILDQENIKKILDYTDKVTVDLENQIITTINSIPFDITLHKKKILLDGLDEITLTLQYEDKISEFENNSMIPSVL